MHVDPMKWGNPNQGEDTRLVSENGVKFQSPKHARTPPKYIKYNYMFRRE